MGQHKCLCLGPVVLVLALSVNFPWMLSDHSSQLITMEEQGDEITGLHGFPLLLWPGFAYSPFILVEAPRGWFLGSGPGCG